MSNKARGFGLSAELARKKAEKFDAELAQQALNWMKEICELGCVDCEIVKKITPVTTEEDVKNILKDGRILCHVINVIQPGAVKKINLSTAVFKEMENISNFLKGCEKLNCAKTDLFQTVDLYEANNIPAVIDTLFALGRKANKLVGPKLGPEEATENKREFTEEQLKAGESVIGLQMGSNKGASQAGQNFGKTRAIID